MEPVAVRLVLPERRRKRDRDRDWMRRKIMMRKAWRGKNTPQPVSECFGKGCGVRERQ